MSKWLGWFLLLNAAVAMLVVWMDVLSTGGVPADWLALSLASYGMARWEWQDNDS